MITVLVGQRGVGKSQLLRRLEQYLKWPSACFVDLDHEIARGEKQSLDKIFSGQGERHFRELERHYFASALNTLSEDHSHGFIALGAGFQGQIPVGVKVLWVRRETDGDGRIFLDRPRLDPQKSPYDEFMDRAKVRHERFAALAHEELTLLEGFTEPYEEEREYFTDQIGSCGGALTVLPSVFHHPQQTLQFFNRRFAWGLRYFELRDDLLEPSQIQWAYEHVPRDWLLLSLRRNPKLNQIVGATHWDWPLEWGRSDMPPTISSAHERVGEESLQSFLKRLENLGDGSRILKAAPMIFSFNELLEGHNWVSEDPANRAFLPRSADGRWRWYRLWMKNRMALNFWREGEGSSPDQPLLLEWVQNDFTTRWFAAVLGDPVEHSWTPAYHYRFFAGRGLPTFRIPITVDQWQNGALGVLEKLGLRFAAVTSPLKKQAYQACLSVTENARKFQSVNTLRWTPEGWQGANTDEAGLRYLVEGIRTKAVAVWGGGGTLAALHAVLPEAQYFSSRTGEARDPEAVHADKWRPEVVIWAVGRSQMQGSKFPPESWAPQSVVDLNYTENSPGREYALRCRCEYRSGVDMFYTQADAQQEFWK